jgi:hypothetical protein
MIQLNKAETGMRQSVLAPTIKVEWRIYPGHRGRQLPDAQNE